MTRAHHHPQPTGGGGVNIAVVTRQTHRQPQTFRQPSEWLRGEQLTPTHRHTSISAPQPLPRPSVTLSPYERQIVRAISGGPERLQPCSGAMEEVAAHRQALLAASHTHSSLLRSLTSSCFQSERFLFPL